MSRTDWRGYLHGPLVPRALGIAVSAVFFLYFVTIAIWHLSYPYEIEWYEGLTMDHIVRAAHGLAIYEHPSVSFSACLYQPLYYYIAAPFTKLFGETFFAGRIVSIVATLGTSLFAALSVSKLTQRSRYAIALSLGLMFSAYILTDYVQTVVRVDSTYVFLLIAAYVVASNGKMWSAALSAVLILAAYYTKQEAVFFYPLLAVWLFMRQRRQAFLFVGILIAGHIAGTLYFDTSSNGWYSYYVYGMPRAKAQYFGYLRVLAAFPTETLKYWGVAALMIGMFFAMVRNRSFEFMGQEGLWALGVASAVIQSCVHRGDQMSGNNVLYPLCAMLAIFLPYVVWRTSSERHTLARVFEWGLLIQLLSFVTDPRSAPMLFPGTDERAKGARFISYLRSYPSDVVIPAHGFIGTMAGKLTHTHCQVEDDVLVMRDRISNAYQDSWHQAFLAQKFSAIIWDESGAHVPDSIPGYYLSGRLPDSLRIGSKMGSGIVRPTFLYLPKVQEDTEQRETGRTRNN